MLHTPSKTGWSWTKHGWKRRPRRLGPTKKVAHPGKRRRPPKLIRVAGAPSSDTRTEAPRIVKEQGRAVSARTPAPLARLAAHAPQRAARHGKYEALDPRNAKG